MQHTWRSLVDRARTYLNDDHVEQQGWIVDDRWLDIVRAEHQVLHRKWTRLGLVRPEVVDTVLDDGTYQITLPPQGGPYEGVLAIVGCAEDLGSYMRYLAPAQPARGAYPFWVASGEVNEGKSVTWAAYGAS